VVKSIPVHILDNEFGTKSKPVHILDNEFDGKIKTGIHTS